MENKELWEKCVDFHGHECGGLTIGYKASLYAMDLLELDFSKDEEVVCIAENDACGVDAIQVILGTSIGKGDLLFHMTGKQAFSFYNRKNGKSVRLILKDRPREMSREESFAYYQSLDYKDMFDHMEARLEVPVHAKIFDSVKCEICGEKTGSFWIRLMGDKKVCLDCFEAYDRFKV